MKTKTIILISVLIVILGVILMFRILAQKSPKNSPNNPSKTSVSPAKVISSNITDPMSINGAVVFKFDKPLLNGASFTIEPTATVSASLNADQDELTIKPKEAWTFNTRYVIKILRNTLSKDGGRLDKDYIFNFQTPPYSGI